jgi:4-amino-4-deoxy-L-arabinose transferase-like glycosyltransferase
VRTGLRGRWHPGYAVAVALVLLAGLGLRLWGIRSGLPWIYDVDEYDHFVPEAVGMLAGNLEPRTLHAAYLGNPPALTYLLAGIYELWYGSKHAANHVLGSANATEIWLIARVVCAALGTGSIWLLYLAGARLFDRRTGLLAAAVLAVAFLPVFYSKLALNDVPALVGVCLSLRGSAGVVREGRGRAYLLAGVGLGVAAATKYTGGIVAVALIAALLARIPEDGPLRTFAWGAGAGVVALVAFVALNPYSVLDWHAFTQGIAQQSAESADAGKIGLGHGSGIVYYLWSLTWGVGWVPAIAAVVGAGLLAWGDRPAFALLVPLAIAYLLFMGLQARYFGRWVMPLVPVVCLLGAHGALSGVDALSRGHRVSALALGTAALIALCGQGVVNSIHSGIVNSRVDTRTMALAWLDAHLARHTRIVAEPISPLGWSTRRFSPYPVFNRARRRRGGGLELTPRSVSIEDYERTLSPALVGFYARQGYCWVVTGSTEEGRAYVDPSAIPPAVGYYRRLAKVGTLVYRASPYAAGAKPVPFNFDWSLDYYPAAYARPGPLVSIYRLHGGRCTAHPRARRHRARRVAKPTRSSH